ncbi:MAG: secondary thiamine-phosphate synthase enzyme YjbQ [Armatimonadetes bacterium]|nr:secondary thiamine-phosphate synthase enzyme YjbQ [Armatimonadota bacterium]
MTELTVRTSKREEIVDITDQIQKVVTQSGTQDGVCFVFCPHTTAAVCVNENADPSVKVDILDQLHRLIPPNLRYHHTEGNADAHIKAVLVGNSLFVPIVKGRLKLGTWQGIFFCEFDGPRTRHVWVQITPSISQ